MGKILDTKKIIIFGDTIVDKSVFLSAAGLSLESPTLKTNFLNESISFGGAANVAKYASMLGADVTFITAIPDRNLKNMFKQKHNIRTVFLDQEKTNVKSRYWVERGDASYKYLQINNVNSSDAALGDIKIDAEYDIIAVSDYRCGLITKQVLGLIRELKGKTFAASQVSSHGNNFMKYFGFNRFVMNKKEANSLVNKEELKFEDFSFLGANGLYITDGEHGCKKYTPRSLNIYNSKNVEVKNVIGAGDVFYASLLASDEDADLANYIAGRYVSSDIGCDFDPSEFASD